MLLRRSAALSLLALSAFGALASSGANATRTPTPDIVSVDAYPFSAFCPVRQRATTRNLYAVAGSRPASVVRAVSSVRATVDGDQIP